MFARAGVPLIGLLLSGCAEEGRSPAAVRADSMGVTIVTNVLADARLETWRVDSRPRLSLGSADGDASRQFQDIVAALRLSDGSIVVADQGSNELRYFDADGVPKARAGGVGGGPGEFRVLLNVHRLAGDTLIANDLFLPRLTRFTGDGKLVETIEFGAAVPRLMSLLGVTSDGEFIFRPGGSPTRAQGYRGSVRDSTFIIRVSSDLETVDTIGAELGTEFFFSGSGGFAPRIAGRDLSIAVAGNVVYWGDQESFDIGAYTPDGEPLLRIRFPEMDLRLSQADARDIREKLLVDVPGTAEAAAQEYESYLSENPLPEIKPAFGRIIADRSGNLWVSAYRVNDDDSEHWRVFLADGTLIAEVEMPTRFRVLEIGDDYVLGRWRDDYGVEYVREHALTREIGSAN
jgi:hypothetical protein